MELHRLSAVPVLTTYPEISEKKVVYLEKSLILH